MKYAELRPLKQSKSLHDTRIWTWDTETKDGLKGKLLFCWGLATDRLCNKIKIYQGKTIDSFFKTLLQLNPNSKKQKITIFVHNLSFDCRFLIDYAIRNNLSYKCIAPSSKIILFYIADLHFRFIDSMQFLLESQEKAEITYEIDEKLRKIDCKDIFRKDYSLWSDNDKNLVLSHNKNDILALQQIMKNFRKTMYDISNVDILQINTLAAFSMKAFRKMLEKSIVNPYLIMIFNDKKFHYELEEKKYNFVKESYFGGRTECYNHSIAQNVQLYDKVSMFPAQMKFKNFPLGIPIWEKNSDKILASLSTNLSIIECKMIPNYDENFPVLPLRFNKKILYANIEQKGIWTSIEIDYAMQRGYKFEFYRALIFPEKFNPFVKFIDTFFKVKSENSGGKRQGAKITLNSSYGKFGQRVHQQHSDMKFFLDKNEALDFYHDKIDHKQKANMEFNAFYEKHIVTFTEESIMLKPFQILHLSVFITAYARLDLLYAIHELHSKKIKLYYSDSDSIFCEQTNLLKSGKELGDWDLEASFSEFKSISPKCYIARFDNSEVNKKELKGKLLLKAKGIRNDKIKEILKENKSLNSIYNIIKDKITFDEQFLPLKSSFIRNKVALSSSVTTKHMSLIDSKRITQLDLSTRPLTELPKKSVKT